MSAHTNCHCRDRGMHNAKNQCCNDNTRTVFFDNFRHFRIGSDPNEYFYFTAGDYVGNDATVDYQDGYLNVNSGVGGSGFTQKFTPIPSPSGTLDHVKYLVFRNQTVPVPKDGVDLVIESTIAGLQQIGNIPLSIIRGVTNPTSDARIASGGMNTIDFIRTDGSNPTYTVFDTFLTNETIYGIYERLPFGKPSFGGPGPDYHAFTHVFEIGKRNRDMPLDDFVKVAIVINRKAGTAAWLVDGVEKFKVNRIGYAIDRTVRLSDLGGPDMQVDIPSLSIGFGNFTLLDFTNPVVDVSLDMAMVTDGSITPTQPLVQLGLSPIYLDPHRVNRATGASLGVGDAPYLGAPPFQFLSTNENDLLFGNGFQLLLKYIKAYYVRPNCK